jgi:hypothetical protein
MKIKNTKEHDEFIKNNFTGIIEYNDGVGFCGWYMMKHIKNGKCHREDGPAMIWLNGNKEWRLNDTQYISIEEWKIDLEKLKK